MYLIEKKDDRFFLKLSILNNNKWEFFDYGWFKNGMFYTNKTKLLIFNILDYQDKMVRREDSFNHFMIIGNNVSYLLFNPNIEIVDMIFLNKN